MKYDTLRARVAADVAHAVRNCCTVGPIYGPDVMTAALFDGMAEKRRVWESLEALAAECTRIVMAWDVRMVGKLRDLFPDSFPRNLRTGPLRADYDEAGNWVVHPLTR